MNRVNGMCDGQLHPLSVKAVQECQQAQSDDAKRFLRMGESPNKSVPFPPPGSRPMCSSLESDAAGGARRPRHESADPARERERPARRATRRAGRLCCWPARRAAPRRGLRDPTGWGASEGGGAARRRARRCAAASLGRGREEGG